MEKKLNFFLFFKVCIIYCVLLLGCDYYSGDETCVLHPPWENCHTRINRDHHRARHSPIHFCRSIWKIDFWIYSGGNCLKITKTNHYYYYYTRIRDFIRAEPSIALEKTIQKTRRNCVRPISILITRLNSYIGHVF